MKKFLATLLIVCSVIGITSFGSEAKIEPSFDFTTLTKKTATVKATYPRPNKQLVLFIEIQCRNGRGHSRDVADNTTVVYTRYSVDANAQNKKLGDIIINGSHTYRLTGILNGQTVLL